MTLVAGIDSSTQSCEVVTVASLTITKLRCLAQHEPSAAARTAAVCLPHDWLTWRLRGQADIDTLTTDRSDASGTGYFDATTNAYRRDLLAMAFGRSELVLPRVTSPCERVGENACTVLGPGAGDNAAAALGMRLGGDAIVSLGTSGVVMARHLQQTCDPTGIVAGFADATGASTPSSAR